MLRWMLTHRARVMPLMCSYSFFTSIRTFRPLFHSDVAVIVATALLLGGCGGGGDGGGGAGGGIMFSTPPDPAQYSGLTTPAALSSSNAEHFTASALGATDSGTGFTTASAGVEADSAQSPKSISVVSMVIELTQRPAAESKLRYVKGVGISALAVTTQEDIFECEDGGQVRERQEFDSVANTTTVTDEYWNCLDADGLTHGTIITRFFGNEPGRIEIEIPALRDLSGGDDLTFTGTLSALTTFPSGAQAITANLVVEDHVAHDSIRIDNLGLSVLTTFGPSGATQSLEIPQGRIFLSEHGYVDIHTETPLLYPGPDFVAPESGGPLLLAGAGPARVSVTPRSVTEVILALDENGDGTSERFAVLPYIALGEGATTQSAPVARITGSATVPRNTLAEFDGSGSYDSNHDLLSFSWVIEAAPAGSMAQLDVTSGWKATFVPDREGQYRIALTVSDGVLSHKIIHAFDAINVAPTASATAGEYAIATVGEVAPLNGSSYDVNGDPMSFAWSIRSRPADSLAVILNPNGAHASFAPDKAGIYELDLAVSDGRLAGTTTVRIAATSAFSAICSSDELAGMPTTGLQKVPSAEGLKFFSALCSGWALIRDSGRNGISIRNLFTGREKEFVPLSASPEKIAFDRVGGLLYVSFHCTPSLTIINLVTRKTVGVPLPGTIVAIAPTDDAHVFVSYQGATQTPLPNGIAYIDSVNGEVQQSFPSGHTRAMLFNRTANALFADQFGSATDGTGEPTSCYEAPPAGDHITRYRFTGTALVEEQTIQRTYPVIPINVSLDGQHGIFTHGTRLVEDRSPSDFNRVQGTWDFSAGDYPQYAVSTAFQPQDKYLAISVEYDWRVELFSTETHARVVRLPLSIDDACGPINEMEFSPGGKLLLGRSFACSTGGSSFEDRIHWWIVPD